MEIQEQKRLADSILDRLSFYPDVVLAGGAPRDWTVGMEAKDLDFFFGGVTQAERIDLKISVEQALGMVELTPISGNKYEDSPFEGYECEIAGQPVQFLFHTKSCDEVVESFPFNSSRVSYRNGEYTKGKDFFYFERYNLMLEGTPEQKYAPDHYYERMRSKFPNTAVYDNKRRLLRALGKRAAAIQEADELVEW